MRMLFIFIFMLIPVIIYCQETNGEIIIELKNYEGSYDFTFETQHVSGNARWDFDFDLVSNPNYFMGGSTNVVNPTLWAYLYFRSTEPLDGMGFSLYKILVKDDQENELASFYWDTRTTESWSGDPDVHFDYNVGLSQFRRGSENINNTTQLFWELEGSIGPEPITAGFEPFAPINVTISSYSGSPKIEWDHYTSLTHWRTGYNIYRSINTEGGPPGSFSKIASVNSTATSYVDWDVATGGRWIAYYKIKAENGDRESIFSSMVSIDLSGFCKKPANDWKLNSFFCDELFQNYPNPFNSETKIRFSISANSHVTLKLYNLLGKQISVLEDGYFDAGAHTILFNSNEISSGVYIYKLEANNKIIVRFLTIVK